MDVYSVARYLHSSGIAFATGSWIMIHKSLSPHQSRAVIRWIDHCTWDCNWWRLDRAESSQPSNKEAPGWGLRDNFNNVVSEMGNVSSKWAPGSLVSCAEWHRTRHTPCHRNKAHPLSPNSALSIKSFDALSTRRPKPIVLTSRWSGHATLQFVFTSSPIICTLRSVDNWVG